MPPSSCWTWWGHFWLRSGCCFVICGSCQSATFTLAPARGRRRRLFRAPRTAGPPGCSWGPVRSAPEPRRRRRRNVLSDPELRSGQQSSLPPFPTTARPREQGTGEAWLPHLHPKQKCCWLQGHTWDTRTYKETQQRDTEALMGSGASQQHGGQDQSTCEVTVAPGRAGGPDADLQESQRAGSGQGRCDSRGEEAWNTGWGRANLLHDRAGDRVWGPAWHRRTSWARCKPTERRWPGMSSSRGDPGDPSPGGHQDMRRSAPESEHRGFVAGVGPPHTARLRGNTQPCARCCRAWGSEQRWQGPNPSAVHKPG